MGYILLSMKKQTINTDEIIEATINYVAEHSLENVTTKKIATNLGISEGSIFNYFPSKKALLTSCLNYIDSKIDGVLKSAPFQGLSIKKNLKGMWMCYFLFLIENGNYSKFYRQFRQSSYYDADVIHGQDSSYSFFTKIIQKNIHLLGFNPDFYWVYIIETTLNFAIRIVDGELPGEPKDIERIYNLMSHGFVGIVKKFDD